jgi:hypothetical protein
MECLKKISYDEMVKICWNLRFSVYGGRGVGNGIFNGNNGTVWNPHFSPMICNCNRCILVRHTKIDKNGRHSSYGDYYCTKGIEKTEQNILPFASSEIIAIKNFYY